MTLDTTEFNNTTTAQNLVLSLTATDDADNTSDANTTTTAIDPVTLTLSIDQNTDRPVVKFTNLIGEEINEGTESKPVMVWKNFVLKYGNDSALEGTISDDDATSTAVVKVFKASSTEITSATVNTTGATTFNAATGDFTFTPANGADDGEKTVYFYIKDNNDNEFYTTYTTGTSAQLGRPYQQYKTAKATDNTAALTYISDSKAPTFDAPQLQAYSEDDAAKTTGNPTALGDNCKVGGTTKNYIDITVSASDDNGIKKIEITANGTTYDSTVAADGTQTTSNGKYVFKTNRIDINSLAHNTVATVTVKVTDNSGLYSNQETSFKVDREAPTIDITTPASDGVTYYGTIKQNIAAGIIGGGDAQQVYFTISEDPDITEENGADKIDINITSTSALSASIVFDNNIGSTENGYHSKFLHDWIKDLRPTTEAQWANYNIDENDDNVPLYVYYKAIDDCGNTKVEKRLINVIPNGDKPSVKIEYPENKGTDKTVIPALAGTIRLNGGTEIQAYSVDSVYIQLAKYTHYVWGTVKTETGAVDKYYTDIAMTTHPVADGDDKTPDDKKVYYFPESTWGAVKGNTLETQKAAMKVYYTNVAKATHPDLSTADDTKVYKLDSTDVWTNWDTKLKALIGDDDYNSLYKDLIVDIPGQTGIKGIKASGTVDNWNLPINTNREFESGNIDMAIRVYAISNSGKDSEGNTKHKLSEPTDQLFTVDANAPKIGGDDSSNQRYKLKLVQFENNHAGELNHIISQIPYQTDMWVKGDWYVLASVYDEQSGIKSIKLDEHKNVAAMEFISGTGTDVNGKIKYTITTSESKTAYAIQTDQINNAGYNYNICIPLPTGSDSGTVTYTIEVTEDTLQNLSCSETLKINYDNTPPKLGTIGHEHYNEVAYNVQQSNGFYHLYGYATDSEAGKTVSDMKAIAFYFVRRGSTTKIYDPMWKDKSVTIATGDTNNNSYTYEYGMFWQELNAGLKSGTNNTLTINAKNDFIHAGGFALVDGIIYTIDRLDTTGTEITLKSADLSSASKAKFAYALVIDNPGESTDGRGTKVNNPTGYGHGYYPEDTTRTADDGDLMYEKWAAGKWEAYINSNNIPDGPIEIHYVAIDNAQNVSVGIVGNVDKTAYAGFKTKDVAANGTPKTAENNLVSGFDYIHAADTPAYVSNNAPRIAGVTVAIDYTGTDTFAKAKQTTYYFQTGDFLEGNTGVKKPVAVTRNLKVSDDTTNDQGVVTKSKGVTTIKGKTWILPEMIGGNGKLWYDYKISSSDTNGLKTTTVKKQSTTSTYFADGNEDYDAYTAKLNGQEYVSVHQKTGIEHATSIFETASSGTGDATLDQPLWFDYTIYDSTEGETDLSKNQKATISIAMAVQVNDTTPPNTVINDLYWKSASDNSVYNNNGLKGHVELKGDLGTSELKTRYGDDDKVSGIVVFRGYAYDNKRLSKLEWAIVDSAGTTSLSPYTAEDSLTYTTGATYASGTWTGSGTLGATTPVAATKHYKFIVKTEPTDDSDLFNRYGTEAYLDEKGHKVYWELAIDTSAIHGTVAEDAKVYIRATDSANKTTVMTGNGSTGSATGVTDQEAIDKATKKPTYQVDIVPYITGVTTALKSKLKTSIVDAYTRTTLGHYIVREGEEVTFTGYNLAGAKYVKTKAANQANDVTVDLDDGKLAVSNDNIAISSEILLKVGSLYTINNMNNNNAKGAFTGTISDESSYSDLSNYAYNRMPNNKGNNLLTDDVYFDVWQFVAKAGEPVSGELREPVVKINPVTGKMGFAFVSGPADFSMPDGHNTHDADVSYTVFQHNYATFSNVSMCYDELGYSYAVVTGLDTYPNGNTSTYAGRFTFQTSRWGVSSTTDMNDNYNGTKKIRLEAIGLPGDSSCYVKGLYPSSYTMTETRFYSPSIVATNHGNDTSVYLAYYDSVQNQIRFRYGNTVPGTKQNFSNFQDNTGLGTVNSQSNGDDRKHVFEANTNAFSLIAGSDWQGPKTTADEANGYTKHIGTNYFYDTGYGAAKYVAIDAEASTSGDTTPVVNDTSASGTRGKTATISNFTVETNAYFYMTFENDVQRGGRTAATLNVNNATPNTEIYLNDTALNANQNIGKGPFKVTYTGTYWNFENVDASELPTDSYNDIVVAVWYDGRNCRYAYTTNPSSGKDNGVEGGWTGNKVIFSDGGEHCAIKIGPDGSIHIAANVDGALKYAYLSSYDAGYDEADDAVTVDSYAITGEKITIDVGRKAFTSGGTTTYKVVPYISYYLNSAKLPAVASLVIPSSGTMNYKAQGTDASNNFTGKWEISIVPTQETLTDLAVDKINVALWKKTVGEGDSAVAGVITGCTDTVFKSASQGWGRGDNGDNHYFSGNGTQNPAIGYAIVTDSGTALSIAQKK